MSSSLCRLSRRLPRHHHRAGTDGNTDHRQQPAPGSRAGLANVAGTQAGLAIMIAIVGIGLTSLIAAMGHWFDWVRLAGAAYLIWLGWKMSGPRRRGWRGQAPSAARRLLPARRAGGAQQSQDAALLRRLLPAIHRPARDHVLQIAIMGLTAMLFAAVSDSAYALLSGRAGRLLSQQRVRLLSRVSGGFLIGGGLWLGSSRAS